jgi:hypothetical protein
MDEFGVEIASLIKDGEELVRLAGSQADEQQLLLSIESYSHSFGNMIEIISKDSDLVSQNIEQLAYLNQLHEQVIDIVEKAKKESAEALKKLHIKGNGILAYTGKLPRRVGKREQLV